MDYIVTVTGEIPADRLGTTLAHEHLCCDLSVHSGKKDNVVNDAGMMIKELGFYRKVGGQTIIEMTPQWLGREPAKLRIISEQSGIQIVSGIGFYESNTFPGWLRDVTADRLTDYMVREIEEGTEGVKAGFIGELASHNEPQSDASGYEMRAVEKIVFQAAAKAQKLTGVAISTHASLGRPGHAQLKVLEKAGADMGKVAIGHCDAQWHEDEKEDMAYYLPILKRGASCAFDLIGWIELMPDEIRAERIAALVGLGYERQLLLSTDTCRLSQLHKNGGRGFDFIWTSFLPRLRKLGITDVQIHSMLVESPKRLLSRNK